MAQVSLHKYLYNGTSIFTQVPLQWHKYLWRCWHHHLEMDIKWYKYSTNLHLEVDKDHPERDKRRASLNQETEGIVNQVYFSYIYENAVVLNDYFGKNDAFD